MKVSTKNGSPCEKLVAIEVPADIVKEAFVAFYLELAPKVQVPGFRKGKAPTGVLASRYRDHAREEVLNKLVRHSLANALKKTELSPLTPPAIDSVEFDETHLKYIAHVEIEPQIHLKRYKGLKAKRQSIAVSEQEVAETIQRLRDGKAKFIPVEDRPAQMGDYLIADVVCAVNGKEEAKQTDRWFELTPEAFLPQFAEQLVGVTVSATKTVTITFPADYGREEWRGKTGLFHVAVKEIKRKELPALTDDFAKEVGEFHTVTALKDSAKIDIEEQKRHNEDQRIERELLDQLIQATKFDVPKGVVERRLKVLVEEGMQTFAQAQMPKEALAKQAETLKERLRPEAERQVRISFLLMRIAQVESLTVTDAEVEERYASMAKRFGQDVGAVKSYFERDGGRDNVVAQMVHEKAFQFIKDHANIKG